MPSARPALSQRKTFAPRHRRASDNVRSMAASRRANMRRGDNQHTENAVTSQAEAAKQVGISVDSLQRAKIVSTTAMRRSSR